MCTVRLPTHVLCKPTHFFFNSFIATMPYSLQTSFNSGMKDWTDKFHALGTPTRSSSRSNALELIQTLYAQNDKENGVDFFTIRFFREKRKCA